MRHGKPYAGILLWLAGWLLTAIPARSSHLVGGDLTYEHLGNSKYRIILTVYKDCNSATPFDDYSLMVLGAYNAQSRTLLSTIQMTSRDTLTIPITSPDPCAPPPPGLCYSKAIYETEVVLSVPAAGMVLAWRRCCRNPTVTNLDDPGNTGMMLTCEIPPQPNSSPIFSNSLPVYTCVNKPLSFDHSATDAEGDSLVYYLVLPYIGGDTAKPLPLPAQQLTLQGVQFASGYSTLSPFGSNSPVSIDQLTGQLNTTPEDIGQFVFAVGVKELRNGTLLGTLHRDIQINVVACPVNIPPKITLSLTGEVKGDTMIFRGGVPRCQTLGVTDVNGPGFGTDSVFLDVLSPLPGAVQPATLNFTAGKSPQQISLCWTPACSETDLSGAITLRIRDNNKCPQPNVVTKTFYYRVLPLLPPAPNLRCVSATNPDSSWMDLTWVLPPADSVANPVGIIVERNSGNGFAPVDTLPWGTTTWRDQDADRSLSDLWGYRLRTLSQCPLLMAGEPGNEAFNPRTWAILAGNARANIFWDSYIFGPSQMYVLESQKVGGAFGTEATVAAPPYLFAPCSFEGTIRVTQQDPLTGCMVLGTPSDTFLIDNGVPPGPVNLCGVGVEDNHPRITWPMIPGIHAYTYTLSRASGLSGPFVPVVETMQDSFYTWLDTTADANAASWCYRLQITDPCGNILEGGTHCSVHLTGKAPGQSVNLAWTPYLIRETGRSVAEYGVYIRPENGTYALAGLLNPDDLTYRDDILFTRFPEQCYKVAAVPETLNGCTVTDFFSNEVCFEFQPVVILPNGFTPNADGANDSLIYRAFFCAEAKSQVIDRWGRTIWTADRGDVFWDGMADGEKAPEGTYFLRVQVVSHSGEPMVFTSPVTLIR